MPSQNRLAILELEQSHEVLRTGKIASRLMFIFWLFSFLALGSLYVGVDCYPVDEAFYTRMLVSPCSLFTLIILYSVSFKLILTPEVVYCWSWLTPLRALKCSDIKKAESFSARGNTVLGLYPQARNRGKITIPYSYFAKADREKIDAFVRALQLLAADGLTEKEEKQFNGFMVFYVMALYAIFLGLGGYAIYKEYFVHGP